MDIRCTFRKNYFAIIYCRYRCILKSVNITRPCKVNSFVGKHEALKTNKDVDGLSFNGDDRVCEFLPTGISSIFPQLVMISLTHCGLKEITAEALMGLEHLRTLHLQHNHLTSLPDDLFFHTSLLKVIDLSFNKLEAMSSQILEPLIENQLQIFNMERNVAISVMYSSNPGEGLKTLNELKSAIDSAFKKQDFSSIVSSKLAQLEESILNGFKKLSHEKDFSDFAIVVGEKEIPVHKSILAVQSSVFASMFKTDEAVKASNKLEIKDCSEKAVEEFVHALYTGKVENQKHNPHALDLLSLASTFDVPALKEVTEILAIKELNEENALKALTLGNLYKSDVMVDAAFKKIKEVYADVKFNEAMKYNPQRIGDIVETYKGYQKAMESLNTV